MFAMAQLDPNNIDQALVKRAYEESQKGLRMSIKPNDRFYVLSLASLQLMNRMAESAELLEILVTKEPKNATYWQQLAATYLNLAGEANLPERQAYEYQVRAILTIQRAQEQGVMNTPRDNFSLVGIYFNIQQFDRAIDLLEKGLRSGGIENTQRNWELLASSYQQLKREFKAIEALKEGMTHFPNAGGLELQVANIYYSIDNLKEALNHTLAALRKGNLDQPSQAQSFGAYIAFELKQFDLALELAQEAAKDPNARDAERLLGHIKSTIQERDEALKSAK
jgi:predicted Zn-dependent protease